MLRKVLVVSMLMPLVAQAQFINTCVDTLITPTPTPPCYPDFRPVCGCDGNTYRNECFADFAGVLQYEYVPCDGVAINITQNPVFDFLYLDVATRFGTDVQLWIIDIYGTLYAEYYLSEVELQQVVIPTYSFKRGAYVVLAESYGATAYKKFLNYPRGE